MASVVEIKFGQDGRTFLYDSKGFELKMGDEVIAVFSDSEEFGKVVSNAREVQSYTQPTNVGKILRKATEKDKKNYEKVLEKSKISFKKVQDAITKFELNMKLVEVKHSFDMTKLFVSYIAENRVDFRELVKYLASIFKTRVELRQMSPREESKILGGCGTCGRPFCCLTFLGDNQQVTIKMAKTQGLALNPGKINGACGKLLCCIAYENNDYQKVLEKMPPLGSIVKTKNGDGAVVFQDLIKEKVTIKLKSNDDDFKLIELSLEELKEK